MLGQYLITFRETLEAALITAIILAYLIRTDRKHLTRYVWYGVYLAIIISLILGGIVWVVYGNLSKPSKVLFEGLAAYIAVLVLTSMIIWMTTKGREIKKDVEKKLSKIVTKGVVFGLIALALILVFREGLETVLFLTPFLVNDAPGTIAGAILGILGGIVLSYFLFKVGMKINLNKFFYYSSILLILLAAGLAGYGTHELIEYGELTGGDMGWFGSTAYALDIAKDSVLHHKGAVGSIFAVMFGYTVKAEWGRVLVHLGYLFVVLPIVVIAYKRPEKLIAISRAFKRLWHILTRPFHKIFKSRKKSSDSLYR
ncbi:FTR1 family protein [Candidatus Pacearchaeota archaeon]|nr:FTR1 family protein [Candidatus Pacearchaeota archaeon]